MLDEKISDSVDDILRDHPSAREDIPRRHGQHRVTVYVAGLLGFQFWL